MIPCLPGDTVQSWLGPVANTLVRPLEKIPFGKREKNVTWFDSRRLAFGVQGPTRPSVSAAVEGSAAHAQQALAAEQAWVTTRRAVRKQARVSAESIVAPSDANASSEAEVSSTGAQRLYGSEAERDVRELSQTSGAVAAPDDEPAVFGRYVHEILATVDLSGVGVEPVARTLARKYGVADAIAARAIQMVERVMRLPLMDDARAATKVFREVPIAGSAAAGRAHGKADLLFERQGEWRVVDFKTDRVEGLDALREHAAQVNEYSTSLAAVVGAHVRSAICLVRRDQVIEL